MSWFTLIKLSFSFVRQEYCCPNPPFFHHKSQEHLGLESELLVADDHDDGLEHPGDEEHPHGPSPHPHIMPVKTFSLCIVPFLYYRSVDKAWYLMENKLKKIIVKLAVYFLPQDTRKWPEVLAISPTSSDWPWSPSWWPGPGTELITQYLNDSLMYFTCICIKVFDVSFLNRPLTLTFAAGFIPVFSAIALRTSCAAAGL